MIKFNIGNLFNCNSINYEDSVCSTLLIGLLLVFLFHLPFLILGHKSFVLIHDNLDSEFVYLHVLKISNNLFGLSTSAPVPNIFNGLQRGYFHSEFSFIRVLFYLFPSFWAYVLNSFIIRSIGFIGILALAESYFSKGKRQSAVLIIGVCFSFLPIYSIYGLSVMGQPLLFWAFLNLIKSKKLVSSFAIIVLFPGYAHIAMTAPFILTALFFYGVFRYFKKNEIAFMYWVGVGVLFTSFIAFNFLTIKLFLTAGELTHRTEMVRSSSPAFIVIIKSFFKTIFYGEYHSAKFISAPIIGLLAYGIWNRSLEAKKGLWIFVIIIFFAGFHAFYDYLAYYFGAYISILRTFNFDRVTFLIPLLFFLILLLLNQDRKIKKSVFYFGISIQLIFILYSNLEFKNNVTNLIPGVKKNAITFQSFYSKKLFNDIESYIGKPKHTFRVVSIGIHPSIAQYNGFYTLDSYQNNYPLSYKKKFRKIIANELSKSEQLKKYYDTWGSRSYIFSAELKETCYLTCKKGSDVVINNIALNTQKLKEMGGRYIFSAVPIMNADELNVELLKKFKNNSSSWEIYLYKIR